MYTMHIIKAGNEYMIPAATSPVCEILVQMARAAGFEFWVIHNDSGERLTWD